MSHQNFYAEDCSEDILPYLCRCQLSTCNICNFTSLINGLHKRLENVDTSLLQEPLDKFVTKKIIFFCDILYIKGPTFSLDINYIFDHMDKLNPEISKTIKNKKVLRYFFCKHHQIFNVENGQVSLKNPIKFHDLRLKWIGKLLQNGHSLVNKSVLTAIQFYSDILYKKDPKGYSTDQLVSHRIEAKEEIQIIATNGLELRSFLAAYPQIFVLDGNNVYLTDAAVDNKSDCSWLNEIINERALVLKTVMFFLSILFNEGQLSYSTLFIYRDTASIDIQQLITTSVELKCFLSKFPEFFVLKKKTVKAKDLSLPFDHVINIYSNQDNCININKESTFPDQVSMLKFKIQEFLEISCLLEVPLEQVVEEVTSEGINKLELEAFLSKFPNDFIIVGNKVILKKHYDKTTNFIVEKTKQHSIKVSNYTRPNKGREEVFLSAIHYCRQFLLQTVGSNVFLPIHMLLFNNVTSPDIQEIIKNEDILRWVINQYSSSLTIYKNLIILKDNDETANVNIIKSKLNGAFKFCLWVLQANVGVNNEFPLPRLQLYLDLASFQINTISELRRFLLEFPDVFVVTYNAVTLKKCDFINKYINKYMRYEKSVYDENTSTKESIAFYSRILKKKNFDSEVTVSNLFGYRTLAPMEVFALTKDPNELKLFLSSHPDIFNIQNDKVSLSKHIKKTAIHKSIENPLQFKINYENSRLDFRKLAFITAINFYSNIMFMKGPNSEHLISCLVSYASDATKEVKEIAKKPTELLSFFSKYPQIFSVNNAKCTVMLADMISFYKNQQNWIKELLPKYHQLTTNHVTVVSGIQFYSTVIFNKGSDYVLPLKILFDNRQKATEDVKSLAKDLIELKNFLAMYPEIFIVNNETISLKSAAISQIIHPKWIEEIVCDDDFKDNFYSKPNESICKVGLNSNISVSMNNLSIIEENRTSIIIGFFVSILEEFGTNNQFPYTKMYDYWRLAPEEVKELIKTPLQLKDFFIKHPEVFMVNNDSIMLLFQREKT